MASDDTVRTIALLVDGLYEGRDEIGRNEIYGRIEAQHVTPEILTYFSHLPDGDYTLDELVDEIDGEMDVADETGDLGLLR
jgi:hypothetical protein